MPCDILKRITLTPALISCRIMFSSLDVGPIVAIIFVRRQCVVIYLLVTFFFIVITTNKIECTLCLKASVLQSLLTCSRKIPWPVVNRYRIAHVPVIDISTLNLPTVHRQWQIVEQAWVFCLSLICMIWLWSNKGRLDMIPD